MWETWVESLGQAFPWTSKASQLDRISSVSGTYPRCNLATIAQSLSTHPLHGPWFSSLQMPHLLFTQIYIPTLPISWHLVLFLYHRQWLRFMTYTQHGIFYTLMTIPHEILDIVFFHSKNWFILKSDGTKWTQVLAEIFTLSSLVWVYHAVGNYSQTITMGNRKCWARATWGAVPELTSSTDTTKEKWEHQTELRGKVDPAVEIQMAVPSVTLPPSHQASTQYTHWTCDMKNNGILQKKQWYLTVFFFF